MSRAEIEQHLREVEQHIARGEEYLASQRQIITRLQRDGHSSVKAEELLVTLEETQTLHRATLELIQEELRSA